MFIQCRAILSNERNDNNKNKNTNRKNKTVTVMMETKTNVLMYFVYDCNNKRFKKKLETATKMSILLY